MKWQINVYILLLLLLYIDGYNAQLLELFLDVLSDNSYYIGNPLTHFIDDSNEFEQKRLEYFQRTKNSLNRNTCLELWSPREITLFEAAISVYGKQFHEIQQEVYFLILFM